MVIRMSRLARCVSMHRIALIRLAFPARHRSQPMRRHAPSTVATIARFAVFALSIAKIII
ncbi:hypothetical protein BSFP_055590 [Burkholderia stabilis]|uniref:Uncharacterized protein n=1 Tax=Burkholderia stabilis TaxID=95485 RepID=A0A1Y1BSD1_9BURK|nr:hypothetical protein BSFP_055590 [Burkholderia stabilis]